MTEAALPKTCDPAGTQARWQAAGAFHPDPAAPGEPFSVVIPPPNVAGSLPMGHAFNTTLIDTIVRFQRVRGSDVLCLPDTDHASIVLQTILEKQLDEFMDRTWDFEFLGIYLHFQTRDCNLNQVWYF